MAPKQRGTNPRRQKKGMTPERQERALKALELRKQGYSYPEIGQRLGVGTTTAFEDVDKILAQTAQEPADQVRALELDRLDEMWKRASADLGRLQVAWQKHSESESGVAATVAEKIVSANQKVFQTQLRIMERRARMTGLDKFTAEVSFEGAQAITDQLAVIGGMSPETIAGMGVGQVGD